MKFTWMSVLISKLLVFTIGKEYKVEIDSSILFINHDKLKNHKKILLVIQLSSS